MVNLDPIVDFTVSATVGRPKPNLAKGFPEAAINGTLSEVRVCTVDGSSG